MSRFLPPPKPRPVRLLPHVARVVMHDGRARYLYPKRSDVLRRTVELQLEVLALAEQALAITSGDSDATRAFVLGAVLKSEPARLWAAVVTSEGYFLPPALREPSPDLPGWTQHLTAADWAQLNTAFLHVNRDALTRLYGQAATREGCAVTADALAQLRALGAFGRDADRPTEGAA